MHIFFGTLDLRHKQIEQRSHAPEKNKGRNGAPQVRPVRNEGENARRRRAEVLRKAKIQAIAFWGFTFVAATIVPRFVLQNQERKWKKCEFPGPANGKIAGNCGKIAENCGKVFS